MTLSRPESALAAAIPFNAATSWVKAAVQCGFNVEPLFRAVGVADAFEQSSRSPAHACMAPQITPAALLDLMRRCVEQAAPRHYFPLVAGESFAFDQIPALETFLTTSTTPRQSLAALSWLPSVLPLLALTLVDDDAQTAALVLDFEVPAGDAQAKGYCVEMAMAGVHKFARLLLGEALVVHHLQLRHDPGAAVLNLLEQSFRLPVRVNQVRNAAVFPRSLLDAPLLGAFPSLNRQAQALVEQQLPAPPQAGLIETIEHALQREPGLMAQGMEPMAQRLNLHPRTLQRRLSEAGVSYSDVLSQLRLRLAQEGLRDPATDVETLSERLGFSDRHSFTRAFKRWTGVTPSEWRRQVLSSTVP